MDTKYDWSKVPACDKWIATDADGYAFAWKLEPEIIGEEWNSTVRGSLGIHWLEPHENQYKGNWRDSLEQRPQEHSHD